MDNEWQVAEGTGWIDIPGFGSINPRRDAVDGGRQYFDAKTEDGALARATGQSITGGPETHYFEFDEPFLLAHHRREPCLEVSISLLEGGRYAVKYRPGRWPSESAGGW